MWGPKAICVGVCYLPPFRRYSIGTPLLFCWFNFLDMKAVKELYERRQ